MFKPVRAHPDLKAQPTLAHLVHTDTDAAKAAKAVNQAHGGAEAHTHSHAAKAAEAAPAGADPKAAAASSEELSRVHATVEGVEGIELTPPHPPREETPAYAKSHHQLAYVKDEPCAICGVRNSTLKDPKQNPFGAKAIETHHYPIERSLLDACDPKKVGVVFPQVKDQATLEAFVDTEDNLMVLCDIHHRHPLYGIHHLVPQDFYVQPFLYPGYQVVAGKENEAAVMAADEALIEKERKEQGQK